MIRLFVNAYQDPEAERDLELQKCHFLNHENPLIQEIVPLAGRATFADFFKAINAVAGDDDISIIANTDIYFDDTLKHVYSLGLGECYALSRWDVGSDGRLALYDHRDSQDVWCFRGKIKDVPHSDFILGKRGCDNAIAARVMAAGYRVYNPSRSIRACHLHLTGIRRYGHFPHDFVERPYLLVNTAVIHETPNYHWMEPEPKTTPLQLVSA